MDREVVEWISPRDFRQQGIFTQLLSVFVVASFAFLRLYMVDHCSSANYLAGIFIRDFRLPIH